jgi:hypothetical protein
MDISTMNSDIMTYGHIITNSDGRFLVKSVKHRTILYVHMVANLYPIDIATQDGIKPNGATIANDGVTNDSCILC